MLQDVIVTPDPHTNSLVVTAPADSMDLVAALIDQLDTPTAVAQIIGKTFLLFRENKELKDDKKIKMPSGK